MSETRRLTYLARHDVLSRAKLQQEQEIARYAERRRKLATIANPIRRRAEEVELDGIALRLRDNAGVLDAAVERHNQQVPELRIG